MPEGKEMSSVSTALMPLTSTTDSFELIKLDLVSDQLLSLVSEGHADQLDEIRLMSKAQEFYEKHAQNEERERYYGTLRVLTEASLGILSFDQPDVIPVKHARSSWQTLAAAFERGKLLEICQIVAALNTNNVVQQIRKDGWNSVPSESLFGKGNSSVLWKEARLAANDCGIDLTTLPSDKRAVKSRQLRNEQSAKHMRAAYAAANRDRDQREAEARRKALQTLLNKNPQSDCAKAFSLLRKTMQAFDRALISTTGPNSVAALNEALSGLYAAEDCLRTAMNMVDMETDLSSTPQKSSTRSSASRLNESDTTRTRVAPGLVSRKLANGVERWEIMYRDAKGRQRRQTIEGGRREAELALSAAKVQRHLGQ